MGNVPQDFCIGLLLCRWQAQPASTLPLAREWLRALAGGDVAGHMQRDHRGRPRLPAGMGDIGWSHAGGRLLLAYAPSGVVGVDVERADRRVDALRIAQRYFTAAEIDALGALDADVQRVAFLRLWCAKEAVLKAHGHGIAFGLSRLAFEVDGDNIRMTGCDAALGAVTAWQLRALTPEHDYLAVLAWRDDILPA